MGQMKPQPKILTIWRMSLTIAMVIPAFANALFFSPRSRVWLILSLVWLALFLILYLWYLPLRYNNLSFTVSGERILLYSGALYTRVRILPLCNIQYVSVYHNPIERIFGLCSLSAVAAGGRVTLPGLREPDAQSLAKSLIH